MSDLVAKSTTLKPYPEGSIVYQWDKQFREEQIALYWENKKKKEAEAKEVTENGKKQS